MKGIVLAGGYGTRLYPCTIGISKQLLPIYDKPMIYYPLSVLMLAGIKDILIISTPSDLPNFKKLLGDGKQFGINFNYAEQTAMDGIAEAFIIAEEFIGEDSVALILGDNIFYGPGFSAMLKKAVNKSAVNNETTVFCYPVKDPERFGVIELGEDKKVLSIVEKPKNPMSDYAITGLYFYNNEVIQYAKSLSPSERGELEITDINTIYLNKNILNVELLGRGFVWLDTGTHNSLLRASQYVQTIEENQGIKIACLEEIAFKMGYIGKNDLLNHIKNLPENEYYKYVKQVLE